MAKETQAKDEKKEPEFSQQVGAQAARKLKAQRRARRAIWYGLGMSGLIGFSVVVPALIGTALGLWIDRYHPNRISWTLTFLILGLIIGCLNAWRWVASEYKEIQEDPDE